MPSYDYAHEFHAALLHSVQLGFEIPQINFTDARFYSDEKFLKLVEAIYETLGDHDGMVNLVGQCMAIHWKIRRIAEEIFGCGCHLTIGYIQEGKDSFFRFTYAEVVHWLKNGINKNKVNLHAWLTLDSMEVIDLTWPSTRAKLFNIKEGWGGVITKHPDTFVNDLRYYPLVVDNHFPVKIKAVECIVHLDLYGQ